MKHQSRNGTIAVLAASLWGGACVGDIEEAGAPREPATAGAAQPDGYAITSSNRLLVFDADTGEIARSMELVGLGPEDELVGADFRPSDAKLYALARSGKIYAFDLRRAALVVRSTLHADPGDTSSPFVALEGEAFGVSFDPVADRLHILGAGQNLRVNVDTGETVTDAALGEAAFAPAYSNAFAEACRAQLLVLDLGNGALFLQSPAGTLAPLATLAGVGGAEPGSGFELAATGRGSGLAYFPGAGGADLFDVELRTGALSDPRTLPLAADEHLLGLALAPPDEAPAQARGELLAINARDELISFNRGAPGKLCTRQPIAGLGRGEVVLGADVRPADGTLYALGSQGNVYTLDAASAEATWRAALKADASDTSAPFGGLDPRGSYGVAFNPVPDRLRVVSRDGLNLRINADTGVTNTDSPLSPSNRAVPAVAYTNAVAGATSTTLYAIDSARGALTRIGGSPATNGACPGDADNPACGVVSDVGVLGMAGMNGVGGFDIDGDADVATGWLALTLTPGTSSSLLLIDLATGAVAPPAGVADPTIGGGEPLRSLTLASGLREP